MQERIPFSADNPWSGDADSWLDFDFDVDQELIRAGGEALAKHWRGTARVPNTGNARAIGEETLASSVDLKRPTAVAHAKKSFYELRHQTALFTRRTEVMKAILVKMTSGGALRLIQVSPPDSTNLLRERLEEIWGQVDEAHVRALEAQLAAGDAYGTGEGGCGEGGDLVHYLTELEALRDRLYNLKAPAERENYQLCDWGNMRSIMVANLPDSYADFVDALDNAGTTSYQATKAAAVRRYRRINRCGNKQAVARNRKPAQAAESPPTGTIQA